MTTVSSSDTETDPIIVAEGHQTVERGMLDERTLTLLNAFENLDKAASLEKKTGEISDTLALARILASVNGYEGHPREEALRQQQAEDLLPHLLRINDTIVSYKVLLGYLLIYADRYGIAQRVGYDNIRDWCYAHKIERDLVESSMKIAKVYPFLYQMGLAPEEIIRKGITPTHATELIGLQHKMQEQLVEQKYAILEQQYPQVVQEIQQRAPSLEEEGDNEGSSPSSDKKKKARRSERLDKFLNLAPLEVQQDVAQKAYNNVLPVALMRTEEICSQDAGQLINRHEKPGERRKPTLFLIGKMNHETGRTEGRFYIDAGYPEGLSLQKNVFGLHLDIDMSTPTLENQIRAAGMSEFGRMLTIMCLPGQYDYPGNEVPDQPATSYALEEEEEEEDEEEEEEERDEDDF